MNTKGFTLVELIAVIVILSLLALITSTAVTKLVSDAKNDLSETQIALIKSAAETWMADNLTYLPDTGQCSYLTLEDLKSYGLLDSNVLDPKNNQEISDDLKIKISTTLSKYGNPVRNVEVNPKNIDGCNKIYELINQKIVNGYASAKKDAIRKHQLNGDSIILGSYTSSEDGKTLSKEGVEPPITVDYDKNVYCEIIEIYNDETIYLANCTVNGSSNTYEYGSTGGENEEPTPEPEPTPVSFKDDSWKTIKANVKAGNLSKYKVGDTKEVVLTGDVEGTYKVRIANTSTPEECNQAGFSQSACGFVIEFVDIITTHNMNSTDKNVGGWPASAMRTYVNETIYNALPQDLRDNIKETIVVSSHGSSDSTNFTSTDKLYLLSTKEVWGKEGTSNVINNDTAEAETRQLDYYKNKEVTTSNYSGAIKAYNGSNSWWWLRSANSNTAYDFYYVFSYGGWNSNFADTTGGLAVAFRIG